jgi:hypothetical protein
MIGAATVAEFFGWGLFSSADRIRTNPRTIRDNPGVYRSIYRGYPRYYGGK